MAYVTMEVDEVAVLKLLQQNHGLAEGDAVGRYSVDFNHPTSNESQTVSITLTYRISKAEIDQLVR